MQRDDLSEFLCPVSGYATRIHAVAGRLVRGSIQPRTLGSGETTGREISAPHSQVRTPMGGAWPPVRRLLLKSLVLGAPMSLPLPLRGGVTDSSREQVRRCCRSTAGGFGV